MFQKLIIVGNLGNAPEMRYLTDGSAVVNFSVAVSDWRKQTTWFRVSVWGKQAENANQYLSKGSKVLVEGTLVANEDGNPRTYETKNGTRASFELNATNVTYLSTKAEASNQTTAHQTTNDNYEDEIPF